MKMAPYHFDQTYYSHTDQIQFHLRLLCNDNEILHNREKESKTCVQCSAHSDSHLYSRSHICLDFISRLNWNGANRGEESVKER